MVSDSQQNELGVKLNGFATVFLMTLQYREADCIVCTFIFYRMREREGTVEVLQMGSASSERSIHSSVSVDRISFIHNNYSTTKQSNGRDWDGD